MSKLLEPELPADLQLPALGPRRLRVFFYTSNTYKFLQARHVFARYGYVLEHFRHIAPYEEEYSLGKKRLLARAINEVAEIVGRNVIFFVEDTSLRIEALSGQDDVPGLAVKEWFPTTSFDELDYQLRQRGNDRAATIKSDIALHLPGRVLPIYFYGETQGQVAETPPSFTASRIHPWLSAETFDGWFVPKGTERRLGEMRADESFRLHFRARALRQLVERLTEYSVVINLPPAAYFVRHIPTPLPQLPLFEQGVSCFVVVGPRAAGKTTFGEFAATSLGIEHYEASTVIRSYHRELQPQEPDITRFAAQLHARFGDDIVTRALVENFGLAYQPVTIITGLRKLEELEYLQNAGIGYRLIYIRASARTRYGRYVQRAREEDVITFNEFTAEDSKNDKIFRLFRELADVIIDNRFSLEHYLEQIKFAVRRWIGVRPQGISLRHVRSDDSVLIRSLDVLLDAGQPLTALEVSGRLSNQGASLTVVSIARALRSEPVLCRRVSADGARAYEALPAANVFIRLLRERVRRAESM